VNAGFAIRCKERLKFVRSRITNANQIRVLDCPCYHYGWVKPDEEMLRKVTQWGHAHQFNGPQWFEIKWLNWHYETVNLGVGWITWRRAIRFPLHQPEFAFQFALPVDPDRRISIKNHLREAIYNARIETRRVLGGTGEAWTGGLCLGTS